MSIDRLAVRRAYEEQREAREAWFQEHADDCPPPPVLLAPGCLMYGKDAAHKSLQAAPLLGRSEVRKSPLLSASDREVPLL